MERQVFFMKVDDETKRRILDLQIEIRKCEERVKECWSEIKALSKEKDIKSISW